MGEIKHRAIIIGDSTNNTLSVVRSLGEAHIEQILILKCDEDFCFVSRSKYLKKSKVYHIQRIEESLPILLQLRDDKWTQYIICSFDEAAVFVDSQELVLSPYYKTPARGNRIGVLFNKDAQCRLAEECGLIVPKSVNFHRSDSFEDLSVKFPILLKPLNSTKGEKGDIHICQNQNDVQNALAEESHCSDFIVQEFIDKEYELDCIGVRTEKEVYIAGAVRKIRHYPWLVGAGAYGLFKPIQELDINVDGVSRFLEQAHYYGPFSVEFLHKDNKNYFMEVNFRNEGLAYAATVAGANLHALYLNPEKGIDKSKVHEIYVMNYSLDFLYVKDGTISLWTWIRDFLRTKCFININFKDLNPIFFHYKNKFKQKLHL